MDVAYGILEELKNKGLKFFRLEHRDWSKPFDRTHD